MEHRHMGFHLFHFRQRLKVVPDVHLDVSERGASEAVGTKGACVPLDRTGPHSALEIPDSGLSQTTKDRIVAKAPVVGLILFGIVVFWLFA
jgi:hypothetical protein